MEEKINGLNELVTKVGDYCNENGIEYVFAAVAEGGKYTKTSHNNTTNVILKEAAKILKQLIKL